MVPDMEMDLTRIEQRISYKLLTALVIPRPIAWVTSLNEDGSINAAPFSFFNVMGNAPPLVALGISERPSGELKDTRRNLEREKEFVVNLADRRSASALHASAAPFPPGVSEVSALGLETHPSVTVNTPRLSICRVHLECQHWGTVEVQQNRVVLGLVTHIHTEDGLVDPTTYDVIPGEFQALGRMQGPGWYCQVSEPFNLGRFPAVSTPTADGKGSP